jgi:hypothetical protein
VKDDLPSILLSANATEERLLELKSLAGEGSEEPMKVRLTLVLLVGLSLALNHSPAGDRPATSPSKELNAARETGWRLALVVVEKLEPSDAKKFPGIRTWLDDFRKMTKGIDPDTHPARWPALDVDALVSQNPNFWRAYFEIAPGDPGLALLHAGLLLSAGEATRASYLIAVARQRPGIPKEIQKGFQAILAHAQKVAERPDALIRQGIKLHDKEDYDGALRKYREALALWPQSGLAHFEIGLSLYHKQLIAAGEKPPSADSVIVNAGQKPNAAVAGAYASARRHDPFQFKAYQGADAEVLRGLKALVKKGLPAWQKLAANRDKLVENETLQQLTAGCQEANIHELALVVRQVLVARRGRYDPTDHPFFSTSVRKLAPGRQTEEVLERLAGGKLTVRQLVAPDPTEGGSKVIALHQLRLYVPNAELTRRIGEDVKPLVAYIKALEKTASKCLEKEELSEARGLLIAVGIKPGKKTRVWCQSVDGEVPDKVLRKLEKELAKVETIEVKKGAVAFGMEVTLRGQKVKKFPEFPTAWLEAAKRSGTRLLVPPDDLFKVIWPD